jgi:dienelactone hydrolase
MVEVVLFHHAQGQTAGFFAFANDLRAAGHAVHAPDLYEGRTFPTLDEGVAHAKQVGFDTLGERARLAAESLPNEVVDTGFSLGAMPAQMLAQTRPGARGAVGRGPRLPLQLFTLSKRVLPGDCAPKRTGSRPTFRAAATSRLGDAGAERRVA